MKRKISLLLAIVLVLTSLSFTGVKAEDNKYVLSEEGGREFKIDDQYTLISYLTSSLDPNKKYTLTLNADLDLSTLPKPVQIKNDFRIEGNNYKISLMETSKLKT